MTERRRGRWLVRILVGLLLVIAVAVVAAYWYMRPMLLTGTGYAAHNACALEHISERDDASSDLPPNPLVPYLRVTSNDGAVDASILGLLAKQTAWHVEGFGCAVADQRPDLPEPVAVTQPNSLAAGPLVETPSALAQAMDTAFSDHLGTRAVVVVHDGRIVAERYADEFTPETPQLGWSMTKSITNLLVGRLVHDGRFDITATGLRENWNDDRARITPDHLMRMTSGLAWDETYDLGTPITEMLYIADDMGTFAADQDLAHPVGEVFQYSSGSTNILCRVMTDQLGADANLPREELFAPLGLTSAVLEVDASGVPVCASYMWATPRDWAAVGQFVLDDGVVDGERLLPEGWIEMATQPTVANGEGTSGYGASWWLNSRSDGSLGNPGLPADVFRAQGHDGQQIQVVPSHDLVVVRMGFSPGVGDLGVDRLTEAVIDWVESQG